MKRATALGSLVSCMLALQSATAGEVANLVTFMPGTPARAAEVNGNFAAVKAAVDDNHARIGTLQSGVSGLDGRVTALESADAALGRWMYGDGSAGDLVISSFVNWTLTQPTQLSFNNCTIQSGGTLMVSAGTTLRCAGTFTNEGTIRVEVGARGGFIALPRAALVGSSISLPQPGDMPDVGGMPFYDTDGVYTDVVPGSPGSRAASKAYIVSNLTRLRIGGSGGGGGAARGGGDGGGLLRVLVNGAITNAGRIEANGGGGSGGGGGGIVILASRASIHHSGTISASGGRGTDTDPRNGAGGGGGGGIVVFASPSVENTGTVDVSGGQGGAVTQLVNGTGVRAGGGGGGGSGGAGGSGASLSGGENSSGGFIGQPGFTLTLQQDPLFVVH